ncbi:MAG: methionine adenosyltransferase [Clostridia bacterium]|nr:methionine adenosyltransferase [Clostridia bacterium]
MKQYELFTSESVTEGHPDKVCDLIADTILDAALKDDPDSRIACEVCATTGMVMVMGEFTTETYIDIPHLVRGVVRGIGYTDASYGFDCDTCAVLTSIDEQSKDISESVTSALEKRESGSNDRYDVVGAGDQGMMFGYACNETKELMPLPIMLAHALTKKLAEVRKNGTLGYLRPDGKAQVTVAYENGKPAFVHTVVVSAQHSRDVSTDKLRADITEKVIKAVIDESLLRKDTKFFVNPSGRFVIGGPHGDTGVTGRKIIVDTYGGMCPHGGGAFSGKDATKVDRSASYYARYVCKNIVAAHLADKVQLQVAYAIGKAAPVSLNINTFGTGKIDDAKILAAVEKVFDFRPAAIIESLGLDRPVFAASTNYGHFGKEGASWERTDKTDLLIKETK